MYATPIPNYGEGSGPYQDWRHWSALPSFVLTMYYLRRRLSDGYALPVVISVRLSGICYGELFRSLFRSETIISCLGRFISLTVHR